MPLRSVSLDRQTGRAAVKELIPPLLSLLLCACEGAGWSSAPMRYTCKTEQMAKVERESEWCSINTDYLSTYCYGAAIMRNCKSMY
jgi:hypothetical protein